MKRIKRYNLDAGVSATGLELFLTCPEQFRLQYIEGWVSIWPKLPLAYGTYMHWILERAYNKKLPPSMRWVEAKRKVFHKQWLNDAVNPIGKTIETQYLVYSLASCILPVYFHRYAGDWPDGKYPQKITGIVKPKKWIDIEKLKHIEYEYDDGTTTIIRVKRDGVFTDKHSDVWVMDHKNFSVVKVEEILESLPMNLQQMLYLWSYLRETGQYPTGVQINILRRPILYRRKGENNDAYYDRTAKDIIARPDHYFIRLEMAIAPEELDRWVETQLNPIMLLFRMWCEGRIPHFANPTSLVGKYGRCDVFNPILTNDFTFCYKTKRRFDRRVV